MNYLLVSPNFPISQEFFAKELKEKGINVLGVGSESYDALSQTLKDNLVEYFRVNDLEDYEEVFRAVAFLTYKHGKINRIESNNEYWLELDARLREDFNVYGVKPKQLEFTKYKSKMKTMFKEAGARVAKGYAANNKEELNGILKKLELPLIAKPDNGVGSANTYKLLTQRDVEEFINEWNEKVSYFFEEFVENGVLCTYDGLINQHGDIVFETSFIYTQPTLDLVNNGLDYANIIEPNIDPKLKELGQRIVYKFGMRERFFHIEFFRLPDGEYIALEYNNRIAGGTCVDLYNYSYNISLYNIYADIVLDNRVPEISTNKYTIALSRRNKYNYMYSLDEIRTKYLHKLRMIFYVPEVFSTAMGDIIIIISVDNKNQINEVMDYVQKI
ncbi:carbamoyl phosphate synthase-like protein [Gemella morbillorum]|uniref:ATP-grasp domain-containing protein n=1 Tax=Gemella morbillorum TaxID=29391 RepID=UPI000DA2EE2E|nr:carbamoyl phosphate synthase large subunit [Gemella morbillorum]UBH80210.1 carbamoyl phosphate synthase large subunit [Gemella morbillorum]SQH55595.1 carbamoyl phosphate synthase-like protein [Gemella morbillorum]